MINIRHGIFETNSSSTHSLVVMTKAQYTEWHNDMYLKLRNEKLTTPEEVEILTKDELIENLRLSNVDNMDKYQFEREIGYYGYIPADNYSSIEGEFENYIILSAYINE